MFGQLIREVRPDVVLHLAWTASSTPGYRTSTANAGWRSASHEAARTCLDSGSSSSPLARSSTTVRAVTPTRMAKAALRADLGDEIDAGHVTWLRPYYVFDPGEPSPAVLRAARAARVAGRPVELETPEATHDFVHAADVGRAVVAAVVHGLDGIVDIGSGRLRTVSALVEAGGATWMSTGPSTHHRHGGARADTALLRTTGWLPSDTERYFAHD